MSEKLAHIALQKQIKDNSEELCNTLLDLEKWQEEIKQKEKLNKSVQYENEKTPLIRSKIKTIENKKQVEEIPKKEELDSLETDSEAKKKRADAEKEIGNNNVKQFNYDQALVHYTNAIEIYDQDSTYYSNRSLCYLKLKKYMDCIADCTKTIRLEKGSTELFIKATFRRMSAYEIIGNTTDALKDCHLLNKLKPNKKIFTEPLQRLTDSLGFTESNTFLKENPDYVKIDFINKPPHLRSKTALKRITVEEFGSNSNQDLNKEDNRIPDEIIDELFNNATGEAVPRTSRINRNLKRNIPKEVLPEKKISLLERTYELKQANAVLLKNAMNAEIIVKKEQENIKEKECSKMPDPPKTGSQFETAWRELSNEQKYLYLKGMINLNNLKQIFNSSLTNDNLSEILYIMKNYFVENNTPVEKLLTAMAVSSETVIIELFMTSNDKNILMELCGYMQTQNVVDTTLQLIKSGFSLG